MTSNMRKSLARPADFQRLYGDHPRVVTLQTLPADPWVGLTIKGWTFDHVTFKGTTFKNVTFENVQFQDVTFDSDPESDVVISNSVFRNCTFRNVTFLSTRVEKTTFSGGGIHGLVTGEARDGYNDGAWKSNTFENMILEDMYLSKDGGHWTASTFRNVEFKNNDIFNEVDGGEFHGCTFEGNSADGKGFISGNFYQCSFGKNMGISGRFQAPKILHKEVDFLYLEGSFEDFDVPLRNSDVDVGVARNIRVMGPNRKFRAASNSENIEFHDIHPGGVTLNDGRQIKGYGIDVEYFSFGYGPFIDCVFKNVTTGELDLGDAKFVRCTFENFQIKQLVRVNKPYPTFENCRFINVRRDPNVSVFEKNVAIDYTFPWESSPGVSKPDTP